MTPPEAAAAHPYNPYTRLWGNKDAWNTQNLFQHDVHGITNSLMTNAGKALNMSDKRQEVFDSTMRDFMKATDRKSAQEILNHAKTIIVNDFGLDSHEADAIIQQHVTEIKRGKQADQVIRVNSREEAERLAPGTRFIGHDGIERVRQ